GDRHEESAERVEYLARSFERALDLDADALGGIRPRGVAERGCDGERMRDALHVTTESRLVELEVERVDSHIFEPVRLIDDDVLCLRKKCASHPRVLQEQRVIDDDDAGDRGSLPRPLQVAVHPGAALTTPLVTRLVVG